jgi:hypothetical protein
MTSMKNNLNHYMKVLPKNIVINIYSYIFNSKDKYIINCLEDRIDKNRYNDIDKHLKNIEHKCLKKVGTLDENVEGYTFWEIGLYCVAYETFYIYPLTNFDFSDTYLHLQMKNLIFENRLNSLYKLILRKPSYFSMKDIRKNIRDNGGLLISKSYKRGKIDLNIKRISDETPLEIKRFSRKFMCEQCLIEDRCNLFKDMCIVHI